MEKLCFYQRIFKNFRPLPRHDLAAIGCTKMAGLELVTVNSDLLRA